MNRTLIRECLKVEEVIPGEMLVATEFGHPERGRVECPAAPAVAGWLRSRGLPMRLGPVRPGPARHTGGWPQDGGLLFVATYLGPEGRAVGVGVAVPGDCPGLATAASGAVSEWSAAMRSRRAVLAATDPSCSGERAALALVRAALARTRPVYVCGELTRSPHVAEGLKAHGAVFTTSLDRVPDGATVLFPAHGAGTGVRAEAAARGMHIVDTTCPLVAAAHAKARSYAERGDTVALVGRRGHAAVAPVSGQVPEGVRLITTVADAETMAGIDPLHVSYLVQTGIPVEDASPVVAALKARFPALRGPHPGQFCYAASDRLAAIRRAAEVSETLIVAGAPDCADSRQVLETATAAGTQAHMVARADDIRPDWIAHAGTVGLTAAFGARPGLISGVLAILSGLGPLGVIRVNSSTETVAAYPSGLPAAKPAAFR